MRFTKLTAQEMVDQGIKKYRYVNGVLVFVLALLLIGIFVHKVSQENVSTEQR